MESNLVRHNAIKPLNNCNLSNENITLDVNDLTKRSSGIKKE